MIIFKFKKRVYLSGTDLYDTIYENSVVSISV